VPRVAQKRREQHKAELRAELIAAAHELVKAEGYEGLTIRKLASKVGYAPMSVYSYFADKQEILFALAEDSFEILAARFNRHRHDDPIEALMAALAEYARFGLDNPNEYRTIFMTEEPKFNSQEEHDELEARNPAMNILLARVQACIDAGTLKGEPHAIATMLWTVAHGAVALLITFPHHKFGDPHDYVMRIGRVALAGVGSQTIEPLVGAGC
jgi:AcrR family transcriptional regulator